MAQSLNLKLIKAKGPERTFWAQNLLVDKMANMAVCTALYCSLPVVLMYLRRRRYPNFAESFFQQARAAAGKIARGGVGGGALRKNNNKDVFRGHGHTKTRVKTTIVDVALP